VTNRRIVCMVIVLATAALAGIPCQSQNPFNKLKKAAEKARQQVTALKPNAQTQPSAPAPQPPPGQQPSAAPQPAPGNTATASGAAPPGPSSSPAPEPTAAARPAGTDESLPFTMPMYALMTFRDIPQFFDETHLAGFATQQIGVEQTFWKNIGPFARDGRTYPGRPAITYEWAKLVDTQPAFADGPLMDVFLRSDPDWSFLNNAPNWDPAANISAKPVVAVLLFSKESIQGRQSEFAAHDLVPVVKRQFEAAIKRLPTHFYFTEALPGWKYDFTARAIRFQPQTSPPSDKVDLLLPMWAVNKNGIRQWSYPYPPRAQAMGVYAMGAGSYWVVRHEPPEEVNPGVSAGLSPEAYWKNSFSSARIPEPSWVAMDRRLQISAIPLDEARAEQITKVGGLFTAKIYFTAERIELQHPTTVFDNKAGTLLYAHFEKVEIVNRKGDLIVTLGPKDFHAAF